MIVLLLVAIAAGVARSLPEPRTIDDAFITFRYSRNIVAGEGFVYNPGTRTLGTTTPFYTLLMAGIGALTSSGAYPWFALVVNALADAVSAVLLAWLAYRVSGRLLLAAIMGLVWAVNPISVTFAIGGMETSVGIMFAVLATTLYVERRERWMALCAALAILTRVDTLLWVGPLLLHQFVLHWRVTRAAGFPRDLRSLAARVPWQSWLTFAAVLIPWYGFSLAYFGTLLSNSLSAKQVAYQVESLQAISRLLQHVATPFMEHETFGVPGIVVGIVLYPALAGVGTYYALRRVPRLLPYLIYPWLYLAVFSLMNPLMFRWYVVPMSPAYMLAVVLGVGALGEALLRPDRRPAVLAAMTAIIGALFVFMSLNAWRIHPTHGPDRPAPKMAWHRGELEYQRVGTLLREQYGVTGDTVVAAGDIGAVGYFSRAHILDTVGLVTPELVSYYPINDDYTFEGTNYLVPPDLILDHEPAYFVIMRGYIRGSLYEDDEFNSLYTLVEMIPTDYYGGAMLVYAHRDQPVQTTASP